jgi:Asp/Glu/hydantoin racemase
MAEPQRQSTVFVLHTSFALLDVLNPLFATHLPNVRIVNIVDDSLLADVRAAGQMTPSVAQRLVGYAMLAQGAGADAIFNACSSVGEVASVIRQLVRIPVVKIDDCMAEAALEYGRQIAVVATVPTTLDPTMRLIESKACERGLSVALYPTLVEGAFDVLVRGDSAGHDTMVAEAIRAAASEADVVVLAQASMARIVPRLGDLHVPVLASPESGVAGLKQVLEMVAGQPSL